MYIRDKDGAVQMHFNIDNGRLSIGKTNPNKALEVNGKIRAKEIIIETEGWSDFVFSEDYELPSLKDRGTTHRAKRPSA